MRRAQAIASRGYGGRAFWISGASGVGKTTIAYILAGQDSLFDDHEDAHPLLSRCIVLSLTNQGLPKPFAARVREITRAEGLNGRPEAEYIRLAQRHRNNFRAMLQAVESGEMME